MIDNTEKKSEQNCTYDPLVEFMAHYADAKSMKTEKSSYEGMSVEERLKKRIIDGDKIGLDSDLAEALKAYPALDIINNILLGGMKVVGELFGSGEMQLPFVLQSAETMKTAVKYLEPFMEKVEGEQSKGVMVLATVKGDVHDIGKNLVDIILTNNGYRVVNLGIKMPLEPMLEAFIREKADAIGMSGLLVKSTAIMKENLEVMQGRGLQIPVVLGGAALTRKFVEKDLRSLYGGTLWYAQDAFDGLHFMEKLKSGTIEEKEKHTEQILPTSLAVMMVEMEKARQELLAVIMPLDEKDLSIPETFNAWSLRDVLVHIIEWEKVSLERIQVLKSGGMPTPIFSEDIDKMNAKFVSENPLHRKDEILNSLASVRTELMGQLKTVSDEEFTRRTDMVSMQEWLANNSFAHERDHLTKISDWLTQREEELDNATGEEAKMALAKRDVPWLSGSPKSGGRSQESEIRKEQGISRLSDVPTPPFWGVDVQEQFILDSIWKYLNEVALFRGQWQLKRGKKTIEEYNKQVEEVARPKLHELMLLCKQQRILKPQAVYGYFPCWSEGDDLVILKPRDLPHDETYMKWKNPMTMDSLDEYKRFTFPRQPGGKHLCISSFFLTKNESMALHKPDVVTFSAVTVGRKASEYTAKLFADNKYVEYLYLHGLSVETAEALAEYLHKIIRTELGIGGSDANDIQRLFSQGYRGSRFSFGYPACPNLEDQAKLFDLLHPERIDITLTEEYHLEPEQSTTAIICHHPEARYFGIK